MSYRWIPQSLPMLNMQMVFRNENYFGRTITFSTQDWRKKTCFKPFLRVNHVQKTWLFFKNNYRSVKPFAYSTWAKIEESNDMTFIHVTSIIKKLIFFIFMFSFSSSLFWKNKIMKNVVLFTFFSMLKEL